MITRLIDAALANRFLVLIFAAALIAAGATRIGAGAGVAIVSGAEKLNKPI